jgi:[ribosomal protein S18]-alanine N-acetyltransferase
VTPPRDQDAQPAGLAVRLVPLTGAHAAQLVTWSYPPPYDVYDMTTADPATLADPASGFYAVLGSGPSGPAGPVGPSEALIGFRSFGADGRVPGWAYDDLALDTGGGLRPDLTGRGLGRTVIAAGLRFGASVFSPAAFRMTVATFNVRAHRVVQDLGFRPVGQFTGPDGATRYDVLLRAAPEGSSPRRSDDTRTPPPGPR